MNGNYDVPEGFKGELYVSIYKRQDGTFEALERSKDLVTPVLTDGYKHIMSIPAVNGDFVHHAKKIAEGLDMREISVDDLAHHLDLRKRSQ